jgi:hypothetical protein
MDEEPETSRSLIACPHFERQLAVALCERSDDFAALGQRRFEHLGDERE